MYILFLVILYFIISFFLKNRIKEIRNSESKAVWSRIQSDIRKVINKYMRNINKPTTWSKLSTDTFIKEVYYATTEDKLNALLPIDRMVQVIKEANKQRKSVKKYEIDEFKTIDN